MTTLREAATRALEALGDARHHMSKSGAFTEIQIAAQEALRTALSESEHEPIGPEWMPCVKLPVTVHVREQRPGEAHVSTREGITPIRPDDLIMRGVAGEEYPIGRELFNRTYRLGEQRTEPVQEPVAWMCADEGLAQKGYSRFSRTKGGAWNIPVYTHPAPDETALLRQCLEALEANRANWAEKTAAITALRERLNQDEATQA